VRKVPPEVWVGRVAGVDVLVIGSGAREHALCRSLSLDQDVERIVCAPGNAGTAEVATNAPVDAGDPDAVAALAASLAVDLVVIGPEVPLVAGAADAVRGQGIACFGPSAAAAELEGSKAFAKEIMAAADVPTSMAHICETPAEAAAALDAFGAPYVVKDDGLAAGKGVVVTEDRDAALAHAAACTRVVIEEYLDGPEVSLFCITDGTTVIPLVPAQDFKRALDGDAGPNTGGMGAYSPLPWAPDSLVDDIVHTVVQPTIDEMHRRGTPFAGLLYAGLALTSRGLRVVEFNARFGDPETQVVLARLVTPLGGVLKAAATGHLEEFPDLLWTPDAAVTVVVAAENYPDTPRTGDPIEGLDEANAVPNAYVLHAGTRTDADGGAVSAGGRVLSVVGTGADLASARSAAYAAIDRISLAGAHHRSDIAARAASGG
jgi:phosphoribosylamine--glycine ligase